MKTEKPKTGVLVALNRLPSGKYRWRVVVGTDEHGRQVRVSGTALSRIAAEQAVSDLTALSDLLGVMGRQNGRRGGPA